MRPAAIRVTSIGGLLIVLSLLVSGCASPAAAGEIQPLVVTAAAPTTQPTTQPTTLPTLAPTPTPAPSPTPLIRQTRPPVWIESGSSSLIVPILLYHRILDGQPADEYTVNTQDFRQQMEWLYTHGYTPIPLARLAAVLTGGGELPARPVVLTFDDGDISVYRTAFPILKSLGFSGTLYLIATKMDGQVYMSAAQAAEMAAAGWEIGSHSMTHVDLTQSTRLHWNEICRSKETLEKALGVPIDSFAYPYGKLNPTAMSAVKNCGYQAAVALGSQWEHEPRYRFNLSRIEIRSDLRIENFPTLLPWQS